MKHHANDNRFIELMTILAEISGQQTTPFKESIYSRAFEEVPIEQLEAAAWALVKSRTFASFPKIGEIFEFIGGGPVNDRAEVEASKVWQAVRDHGGWSSVCFDDPITQAVIVRGFDGWTKMCSELMEDKQRQFRFDFARMYSAFSRQGMAHYGALSGRGAGDPKLIGDRAKAMAVLEGGKYNPVHGFISAMPMLNALI